MEFFAQRCPWYIAGPLIGVAVTGLLWVANRPLGALGGYIELYEWMRPRDRGALASRGQAIASKEERPDSLRAFRKPGDGPGWRVFFFLGIVLGGFLSAVAAGDLEPTLAYGSFDVLFGGSLITKALILVGAGLLMGLGARTAGGCTSGHGVCGTSLGSPASWVATATFMATAIASANVLAWLLGGPP